MGLPADLRRFACKLLDEDPTRRPSAAEALKDPYFTQSPPVINPDHPTFGLRPLSSMLDTAIDFHEYSSRQRRKAAAAAAKNSKPAAGSAPSTSAPSSSGPLTAARTSVPVQFQAASEGSRSTSASMQTNAAGRLPSSGNAESQFPPMPASRREPRDSKSLQVSGRGHEGGPARL